MCSTFFGVDVVGIGMNHFAISIVILETNFNFAVTELFMKVNWFWKQRFFVFVEIINKLNNSALKLKNFGFFLTWTLVFKFDNKTFVKEGNFSESCSHCFVVEVECLKNFVIRHKCDHCATIICFFELFEFKLRNSAFEFLIVVYSVLENINLEPT